MSNTAASLKRIQVPYPVNTAESFAKLAEDAKTGCLMSRLLKTTVTIEAQLIA